MIVSKTTACVQLGHVAALEDVDHVEETTTRGVESFVCEEDDGVGGALCVRRSAVDVVPELEAHGVVGRRQSVGVVRVAGERIARDALQSGVGLEEGVVLLFERRKRERERERDFGAAAHAVELRRLVAHTLDRLLRVRWSERGKKDPDETKGERRSLPPLSLRRGASRRVARLSSRKSARTDAGARDRVGDLGVGRGRVDERDERRDDRLGRAGRVDLRSRASKSREARASS